MDEYRLLLGLYSYHKKIIADLVIDKLKRLRDKNFLLSGDDSGLQNIWEEICVQKQGGESFFWESYENTIENFIQVEIQEQHESIIKLFSYLDSIKSDPDEDGDFPDEEESTVNDIKELIIDKAEYFENENIYRYLNGDEELEDEEEIDDENGE